MHASDWSGRRVAAWWLTLSLGLLSVGVAHAEGDREQEALRRLKQQLRQVQQQQATAVQEAQAKAEADKAAMSKTLQSAQSEAAAQKQAVGAAARRVKDLTAEVEALKKDKDQLNADLAALKQGLEEARAKAAEQQAQASATVASWQARHQQVTEAENQCRSRNAELYQLGSELLDKYEHKGMGEVLSANEPFLQFAKVQLENARTAYQDKLEALRLKAAQAAENKP